MDRHALKLLGIKNAYTQYDVLCHFQLSLFKALKNLNVEVSLVDFGSYRKSILSLLYKNPIDVTLCFNGPKALQGNTFLADILQIPHVAWLLDNASYFSHFHESPYYILICSDFASCQFMKQKGCKNAFFIPHGFDASYATSPETKREYPISFLGTLLDPILIEETWDCHLQKNLKKDLQEAAFKVLYEINLTEQEAFLEVYQKHQNFFKSLSEEAYDTILQDFDCYLKAQDRILLLQACFDLPVHIFGNSASHRSWETFLDLKKGNYVIHPPVTFDEGCHVMKNSQILLNSSSMFKLGAHERILYGLGCGALVISNETPWLNEHFIDREDIVMYQVKKFPEMNQKIKHLLKSWEERISCVKKGQAKVLLHHTWDVRAKSLLNILNVTLPSFDEV